MSALTYIPNQFGPWISVTDPDHPHSFPSYDGPLLLSVAFLTAGTYVATVEDDMVENDGERITFTIGEDESITLSMADPDGDDEYDPETDPENFR